MQKNVNTKMTETEIIYEAINHLEGEGGVKATWKDAHGNGTDGTLSISFNNNLHLDLHAEIKLEIRSSQINQLANLAQLYVPFIVVAARIFPKVKEQLRHNNINYLDAAGNIYIAQPNTYINISGKKNIPPQSFVKGNRAFTKTGLRVIYQFLMDPELVNASYRDIAHQTGTAVGNLNNIFTALKNDHYLLQLTKDEWKLVNMRKLLDKWIDAYEQRLKPSLSLGTYRFLDTEDFTNWKKLPVAQETVWGGEPAGAFMTDYLRPEELTIYTSQSTAELMSRLRLVPDKSGRVKVFRKFWQYDNTHPQLVHPILAYADLISKGDRRCAEVAEKIFNGLLQDKF